MQPISSSKINFFFFSLTQVAFNSLYWRWGGEWWECQAILCSHTWECKCLPNRKVWYGWLRILTDYKLLFNHGNSPVKLLISPTSFYCIHQKKKTLFKSVVFVGKNMWLVHLLLWLGCFLLSISLFELHYRNCRNWYLSLLDLIAVFPFE